MAQPGRYVHVNIVYDKPTRRIKVSCSCKIFRERLAAYLSEDEYFTPSPDIPVASCRCSHHCLAVRHFPELWDMTPALVSRVQVPGVESDVTGPVVIFQDSRQEIAMVISVPRRAGKRAIVTLNVTGTVVECRVHGRKKNAPGAKHCPDVIAASAARALRIKQLGESDDEVRRERDEAEEQDRNDRRRANADPCRRLTLGRSSQVCLSSTS